MENCPYGRNNEREITVREQYIGRDEEFQALEQYLINNNPVLVLGPEGIGKSNFISCFCRPENRKRLAAEHRILISRFAFPTALTDQDAIYRAFSSEVKDACSLLLEVGDTARYEEIMRQINSKENMPQNSEVSLLKQICNIYKDHDCCVYLFVDQFERFINNQSVCMEHHDILRYLLDNKLLNMVVTSDYDLNTNTLPNRIRGSYLLQRFTVSLTLKPLSFQETCRYIGRIGSSDDFTENELKMIYKLSGGIPVPARCCAYEIYQYKQAHPDLPVPEEEIRKALLKNREVQNLIDSWLCILDEREAGLLNLMQEKAVFKSIEPISPEFRDNCCSLLVNRGLIRSLTERGRAETWCYDFNSLMLMDFCCTYPVSAHVPPPLPTLSVIGLLSKDLSPTDFREQFLAAVREKKLTFEQASSILLKYTDDLVNLSADQQIVLEKAFQQYHSSGQSGISDSLLTRVSPRTKEYLMMAVVMEKRMPTFAGFDFASIQNDASAKILYYGKALEQHLRDHWVTFMKLMPGLTGTTNFKTKDRDFLTIGNFETALRENQVPITDYCRDYLPANQNWENYIESFINHIGAACTIRNSADHADNDPRRAPSNAQVAEIKRLCIEGNDCIFECCFIADQLMKHLKDMIAKNLVNKNSIMVCETVDAEQNMYGYIKDTEFRVMISGTNARKFMSINPAAILDADSMYAVRILGQRGSGDTLTLTAEILAKNS